MMAPAVFTAPASYEETSFVLRVTPDALTTRSAGENEKRKESRRESAHRRSSEILRDNEALTIDDGTVLQDDVTLPSVRNVLLDSLSENDSHPPRLEVLLEFLR